MSRAARREPGQALALFALGIIGFLALVALVVDGGFLYVQRRTAQAAADAGALAGARALRDAADLSTIRSAATTMAQQNQFGIQPTVQCVYLVDTDGRTLGSVGSAGSWPSCPSNLTASTINGASGVHVDVRISYPTFLTPMLGLTSLAADGHASAQLGTPSGVYTNDSPLIVCGGGSGGAAARVSTSPVVTIRNGQPTLVSPYPPLPIYTASNNSGYVMEQFLQSDGTFVPAMNGHVYYLKGRFVGSMSDSAGHNNDCGADSNKFDGGAAPDQVLISVPGTLTGTDGNTVANIGAQVAAPGGCAEGAAPATWNAGDPGCIMILPVANGHSGSTTLMVQTLAAFYVWCNKGTGNQCQEYVGQLIEGDDVAGRLLTNIAISNNSPPTVPVAVHLTT